MNNYTVKQHVPFTCNADQQLGAYRIAQDEPLLAVADGMGKFQLYVEWAEGSLGKYTAAQVNAIAGHEVVQ